MTYLKQNQRIASYSFTDLITNVGYLNIIASDTNDATAGTEYILMTQVIPTDTKQTSFGAGATKDFEITFQQSQILEGDAIIRYHWLMDSNGNPSDGDCTVSIVKNSTVIASSIQTQLSTSSLAEDEAVNKITLPRTHFGVGDVLKLRFVMVASNPGRVYLLHDPANGTVAFVGSYQSGNKTNTKCEAYLPFKVIS